MIYHQRKRLTTDGLHQGLNECRTVRSWSVAFHCAALR